MKKLTKKEKEAVIKAAALVETRAYIYSCMAVQESGGRRLRKKYAEFYNQSSDDYWPIYNKPNRISKQFSYIDSITDTRVLLLLTFAEVG